MESKSIVEFLWGSPIITEKSDEDWLIFVDKIPIHSRIRSPQLAGLRPRQTDCVVYDIESLPILLYDKPFYNCLCLFAAEYVVDEAVDSQILELVSMREDIASMNLPAFYSTLSYCQDRIYSGICKVYNSKRVSKLIQDYALVDYLISNFSFEESLNHAIAIASPTKLGEITQEDSIKVLNYYKERFEKEEVKEFFDKSPDADTYAKVKSIIYSIDLRGLSGVPVRRCVSG